MNTTLGSPFNKLEDESEHVPRKAFEQIEQEAESTGQQTRLTMPEIKQ